MLRLDTDNATRFIEASAWSDLLQLAQKAHRTLVEGTGAGNNALGWRRILQAPNDALLEDIEQTAVELREKADVLLCIGIGGSYLGARAVIEALSDTPLSVRFAGQHISGHYLQRLLDELDGRSVYVNVISKSGTTLEPALAFRIVRHWMQERFDDVGDRIIVTTDPTEGALNDLQDEIGCRKYEIPRDVGGRFSVLTPVGLLPIAAAGIDVRALLYGAVEAYEQLGKRADAAEDNPALRYAALRYGLLQEEYAVDVLATFEPRLAAFGAWWQQLFGESEGKDHQGLYPATVNYTTDLHSLGQYMQDGRRIVAETFLMTDAPDSSVSIPPSDKNVDGLDYLTGRSLEEINRGAYEGTAQAHTEGGVPNQTIWLDRIDAPTIGECIYFFEHAVAVGGYMLGINPFDQPGVEAYKSEMYRRLQA